MVKLLTLELCCLNATRKPTYGPAGESGKRGLEIMRLCQPQSVPRPKGEFVLNGPNLPEMRLRDTIIYVAIRLTISTFYWARGAGSH